MRYVYSTAVFIVSLFTIGAVDDKHYVQNLSASHLTIKENKAKVCTELCNSKDIPYDINFNLIEKSQGRLQISFVPLNKDCIREIALLVNGYIKNEDNCNVHKFHASECCEDEVHTIRRKICTSLNSLTKSNDEVQNKTEQSNFTICYDHVFTGCYALRFKVNGDKFIIRGNKFLTTEYERTEVAEPKLQCYFYSAAESDQRITVTTGISIPKGPTGAQFELLPLSAEDKNKEHACILHSKSYIRRWKVNLNTKVSPSTNCSVMEVNPGNGQMILKTECNFETKFTQKDSEYCLLVRLHDDRCHKNTIWKIPPASRTPCQWILGCSRSVRTFAMEQSGVIQRREHVSNLTQQVLPIIIVVIVIVFAVVGSTFFVYRLHVHNGKRCSYTNTNTNDLKNTAGANIDGYESIGVIQKDGDGDQDKTDAVVLMYVKDSSSFTAFINGLQGILEERCQCHVYNWYGASESNEIARVGGSAWVTSILQSGGRVVWMDTPRARCLLTSYLEKTKSLQNNRIPRNAEIIGDFRDIAFPEVLDVAKRNMHDLALQYRTHFVVRLEGLETADETNDPFKDLSPHTRYVVPYHLSQLCSRLSRHENQEQPGLDAEETLLRDHLIKMKVNL
ncbi:uncharacterized protein LOC105698958 [Orussus abietinus]|uniref:uncharacterized protein LOC105698958 n=1 Tax=Orussus abietinus TaxID=222816 RepID=UPI000625ABC8|nr:uncharacterized protein LOC105698958 [Orussus abietinus]